MESDGEPEDTLFKPLIDSNLAPIRNHTLREWNTRFTELSEAEDFPKRNHFALTGIYHENDTKLRAKFDSSSCKVTDDMPISQECDIDSVIGVVTGDLPIRPTATFEYFPLPDSKFTLQSSLHIPGIRVQNQEEDELLDFHRIPNCRFGDINRALVRIFFPGLRTQLAQSPNPLYVAAGLLETFYNTAVQPAAMETIPELHRRTWPSNYQSEDFRARSGSNLQQSAKEFPGQYVNPWLTAIREKVVEKHEISWARGFFLMVEVKGVKHRSSHEVPASRLVNEDGELIDQRNPRTLALKTVLNNFMTANFAESGRWYLDIATTISVTDNDNYPLCAFVNTAAHAEIIKSFTGKTIDQCHRWVNSLTGGGGIYQRDEVAHLGDLAGFRLDLSKHEPGDYGLYYMQVYSTEKSVTYHLDGVKRAKRSSAFRVIDNWNKERQQHFIPLQKAFIDASQTHDVAVRIESRVEYDSYPLVHLKIDEPYLRQWLLQLDNTAFWGFKANRLMAIQHTLNTVHNKRALITNGRLGPVASLIVLLVWMANALVNRPDEGGNWDEVRDSGCVHVKANEQVVPYRPLVIYNLHSVHFSVQVPRLSSHRIISKDTLRYLCTSGHPVTESELLDMIRGSSASQAVDKTTTWNAGDEPVLPATRVPASNNRQQRVRIRLETDAPNVLSAAIPDDRNHEDVCTSGEEDPEEQDAPVSLSARVSGIIHNYPVQIFRKAPNKKSPRESWCILDAVVKSELTDSIFRDRSRLPETFLSYTLYPYDPTKWKRTVECYFPTPDEFLELNKKGKKIQGLAQLGVWQEWGQVLRSKSKPDGKKLAKVARDYINSNWTWLPAVAKNHLWATGDPPTKNAQQIGNAPGGPWIVYNPRFR